MIAASLVPGPERRDPPGSVEEVLEPTGTPPARKEVAVVRDVPFEDADEELGRAAVYAPVGYDGFRTLP